MATNHDEGEALLSSLLLHSHLQQGSRKQVFDCIIMTAQAIAQTFAPHCEVVVHDFANLEQSIVALFGNVTGRKVGGSVTDLGLLLVQDGPSGKNILTYETQAPDGRRLKSTSVLYRDEQGRIFGALCINLDTETIRQAAKVLMEWYEVPVIDKTIEEHFLDEPVEVISGIVQEEWVKLGLPTDKRKLKREQRKELVQVLRERGVFNMRNAPTLVANLLGISRFTVYNYLNDARIRNSHKEKDSTPSQINAR